MVVWVGEAQLEEAQVGEEVVAVVVGEEVVGVDGRGEDQRDGFEEGLRRLEIPVSPPPLPGWVWVS